jgi:hypothetical protein
MLFLSVSFFVPLLLGCTTEPSWSTRYENEPQETLLKVQRHIDVEEREIIALRLLALYPKDHLSICVLVESSSGKKMCTQYANRPHLWTIAKEKTPNWEGGYFFERILFPPTEIPVPIKDSSLCSDQEHCLIDKALEHARHGAVKKAQNRCAAIQKERIRWECMFQASEAVRPTQYAAGVELCLLSGNFAPECHNHLLLRMVQEGWLSEKKHEDFRNEIQAQWGKGLYSEMLLDLYWSALASRVLGVTQPFSVEDVPVVSDRFLPHLHSALALRTIFTADPMTLVQRAKKETTQLEKAHGPNSPVFQPRRVWKGDTSHSWIHFCDLRGGIRPTSTNPEEDIKLAIMTAAMMTVPPKTEVIQQLSKDSSSLIRWAASELLAFP